ncbi:hypothetical protein FA95DRAFT_1565406 [Auriscalpium vulgare]|uniref:Uncharacterized protein n=1 Tax=Auriscalpium vulgare TaxID=40419 RepID=A0ACB8RCK0_9AGAM|nr:hypothetical protein FA95DRAFT_1565406 [Auriscalpium vulgare]
MGMLPNAHSNMAFFDPRSPSPDNGAQYQIMAQQEQRRQQIMAQAQNAQVARPQTGGPPALNGLTPGQMQGVGYANIPQQGGLRRVASHPGPPAHGSLMGVLPPGPPDMPGGVGAPGLGSEQANGSREHQEEAHKPEPSAHTSELSQRVEELESRLSDLSSEHEVISPSESPAVERAPSSTSGVSSSSLSGTPKHNASKSPQAQSWQSVHPTLSSWKKLMTRLATAIDHVEDLARTSADHEPSLCAQVVELRNIFAQHQLRYTEFVKLSKEYTDQFLHDLSNEIRSQSAWLELLERRLGLAKTLRSAAVDLGASFEKGVCGELKGVRAVVRRCPLDEEAALFDELDELIGVIKACYVELDKFWTDEVRHIMQALKERRVDKGEGQYWRGVGNMLDAAVNDHETSSDALQSLPLPLPHFNSIRSDTDPERQLDAPEIAATLIPAISSIQASLASARNFRRDFSVLKAKHLRRLERACLNVEQNKQRCLRFFGDCVTYAGKAAESAGAAFSRPDPERVAAMLGLRGRAATLMKEGPIASGCAAGALIRVPDSAGKKVNKSFSKLGEMLRDGERLWRSIVHEDTHIVAALFRAEEEISIEGWSIKQLKKTLCKIDKEKGVLRRLSVTSY